LLMRDLKLKYSKKNILRSVITPEHYLTLKIYKELVNRYVVDLALFGWPKVLSAKNNPETFSKLYIVTFAKLQEIGNRYWEISKMGKAGFIIALVFGIIITFVGLIFLAYA
jgi:hypothetical protein